MATFTWLNGASGSWTDPAEWGGTSLPAGLDAAIINAGTVTLDVTATVGQLSQVGSGSTLQGIGQLNVLNGGTFIGTVVESGIGSTQLSGQSVVRAATGSASPGVLSLDGGRSLVNNGSLSLDAGTIALGLLPGGTALGGGSLVNNAGGTITIDGSGVVIATGTGDTGVVNTGLLLKRGMDNAIIQASFSDAGMLHVQAGTLTLAGGGYASGSGVTVDAGAVLELSGGTFAIPHGAFAPAGTLLIDGAAVDFTGASYGDLSGSLIVSAGSARLGLRSTSVASLAQTASGASTSLITAPSAIVVLTEFDVTGTAVQTGSSVTRLFGHSYLGAAASGATSLNLDNKRKMINYGTMTIASGGIVLGANPLGSTVGGATFVNANVGKVIIQSSGDVIAAGSGTLALTNSGTIEVATTGVATIGVNLVSHGTVNIQSGTLNLAAGGIALARNLKVDAAGTLAVSGGTLALSLGTVALDGGLSFSGGVIDATHTRQIAIGGTTSLSGGTLIAGARPATFAALAISGGTISSTAMVTASMGATFTGTSVEVGRGTTKLDDTSTLNATGSGAGIYLDGRRILQNNSTLVITSGTIHLGVEPTGTAIGDGYIANIGTMDIQTDGTVIAGGAGSAIVTNYGLFEKTAGSGTAEVHATFVNNGSVAVQSGTLLFSASASGGDYTVDSGTVLQFSGRVGSGTMTFIGSNATILASAATPFGGTVAGLGSGNKVDLAAFAWDASATASFAAGVLTVTDTAGSTHLNLAGSYGSYSFALSSDGHGGLLIG